MLLRRVLRRRLVRVSIKTEVLRRVLERGCVIEGAWKVLRRQKHALSQSTTPFACTLFLPINRTPQLWRAKSLSFQAWQGRVGQAESTAVGGQTLLQRWLSLSLLKFSERWILYWVRRNRDFCDCDCEFPMQARNRCDFRRLLHKETLQFKGVKFHQ